MGDSGPDRARPALLHRVRDGAGSLDRRRRRRGFPGANLGRPRPLRPRVDPFRFPPPLPDRAVEHLHGIALGPRMPDLRDPRQPWRSLRRPHLPRSPSPPRRCALPFSCPVRPARPGAGHQFGAWRRFGFATAAHSRVRQCGVDRRRFGLGGCDHGRGPLPGIPAGAQPRGCIRARGPPALCRRTPPPHAAARLHGGLPAPHRSLPGAACSRFAGSRGQAAPLCEPPGDARRRIAGAPIRSHYRGSWMVTLSA